MACIIAPLGVCIIATGWGLTTIKSSPRAHSSYINSLALRVHYSFLLAKKRSLTLAETPRQGKADGWGSLNTMQEGREKGAGGVHCLKY